MTSGNSDPIRGVMLKGLGTNEASHLQSVNSSKMIKLVEISFEEITFKLRCLNIYELVNANKSYQEISESSGLTLATIKNVIKNSVEILFQEIISRLEKILNKQNSVDMLELQLGFFSFYQELLNDIQEGTRYRNPIRLVPIALYLYLKKEGFNLLSKDFIVMARLTGDQFRTGLKCVVPNCPSYITRDKKDLVLKRIRDIR
ncbi:MAG: hypothetical protein K1060chlam4_00267, partial [Candidatus Anoxychlamydiales bacterium]|nr:hypothetical protein [Candidatus Anoxychlamydiales bacterium]